MVNQVFGPFAPITCVNGVTPLNATLGNLIQTQASIAMHGFGPDELSAGFVMSGCAASGTVGTATVNIASGRAYAGMTDGTYGLIVVVSTTQTTSTPSTTYHLYLQPDGTWYWSTSNSPQAGSVAIAQVTTDGSGHIATITDLRPLVFTLFPGSAGTPALPQLSTDAGVVTTDGLGALSITAPAAPSAPSAATAASSGTTYSAQVVADGAIAYYKLTDTSSTVVDAISAHNLTAAGGFTQSVAGLLNGDPDNCTTFNGTTGKATGTGFNFLPSGNASWSMECWVQMSGNPGTTAQVFNWGVNSPGQIPNLLINTSGTVQGGPGGGTLTSPASAALALNTRHHLALTYDGTTMRCYVDGAQVGTATPAALTIPSTSQIIAIAVGGGLSSNWFGGQVEKAAIYSTALSAGTILTHYQLGNGGPGAAAQNLGIGTYKYTVTFATAVSETVQSAQTTLTTTLNNQKGALTNIPTGPHGTTKRNIYRTVLGGSVEELLTSIADNVTTTYTDSTPDGSLGAAQVQATAGSLNMSSINGQPAAGLAVPVIVAQALNVHVTTTGDQTILSWTPSVTGLYAVRGYATLQPSTTSNITFRATFKDPNTGGTPTVYFIGGPSTPVFLNAVSYTAGSTAISPPPMVLYAAAGTAIVIHWNESAGTPNDFISALIERLA